MHLHWEKASNTAGDCNIRSLSWMGRVPDEIPQDEGWKLNRVNYYQEGWLSTANMRGIVGVTYTTSHCNGWDSDPGLEVPARTNYNLRGHRSEVTLVRWNEPYQKLASCDTSGIIFVWIKYDGRWSIELINDRSTPVICFSWSHDGMMALICYQDGFILVGSVTGQRFWSTLLPQDVQSVTAATWTPDDKFVYLGTSQGDILVMDVTGNTVARVNLCPDVTVTELAWNCERFNMEEPVAVNNNNSSQPMNPSAPSPPAQQDSSGSECNFGAMQFRPSDGSHYVLAVGLKNGRIMLMRSHDDIIPTVLETGLHNYVMDWTNSGETLAVAGKVREMACPREHSFRYINRVKFYTCHGNLIYSAQIPTDKSPVTALTWGHNDKRLFIAAGNQIHVGWVSPQVATLQLLSRLSVHRTLASRDKVHLLPLPCRLQNLIELLYAQTIRSIIPTASTLRQFAIEPHAKDARIYCTMVRHRDAQSSANGVPLENNSTSCDYGATYTLYVEHMGGFLPLLKGKKVSKIRPEFVIYDPTLPDEAVSDWESLPAGHPSHRSIMPMSLYAPREEQQQSESLLRNGHNHAEDVVVYRARGNEAPNHPPLQGRLGAGVLAANPMNDANNFRRFQQRPRVAGIAPIYPANREYLNILPEDLRLAEVTSNFWGTKFRVISPNLAVLPPKLLEVVYKASLLHLQPRQMRLELVDLRDSDPDPDPFQLDDSDDDNFVQDDDEANLVTMKDNILTAAVGGSEQPPAKALSSAAEEAKKAESEAKHENEDENTAVAPPIAPLPTRLSFCLSGAGSLTSSIRGPSASTPCNENAILESILKEESLTKETPPPSRAQGLLSSTESPKASPIRKSPVKTVVQQAIAKAHPAPVELPNSIAMNESVVSCPPEQIHPPPSGSSPSRLRQNLKQQLRMSVSCDNSLSEANLKFALSRRDSVGSGSPHSSRGSPRRWAAKVDELVQESVEGATAATVELSGGLPTAGGPSLMTTSVPLPSGHQATPRSSSATDLDVIVDLLGVPSDLLGHRTDLNKRLVLLKEVKRKKRGKKLLEEARTNSHQAELDLDEDQEEADEEEGVLGETLEAQIQEGHAPGLDKCGKSRSCDDNASLKKRRSKKRRSQADKIELKRRSIYYSQSCRGRSQSKTCLHCESVAKEINDKSLNQEIFDVVVAYEPEELAPAEVQEEEEEEEEVEEEPKPDPVPTLPELMPIRENIPIDCANSSRALGSHGPSSNSKPAAAAAPRRFDSVRSLLEKVRNTLLKSTNHHPKQGSEEVQVEAQANSSPRSKQAERLDDSEDSFSHTQSSPNTPLLRRKRNKARNRSFSPVKAFLNSPLLRRRKRGSHSRSRDSSPEDLSRPEPPPAPTHGPCPSAAAVATAHQLLRDVEEDYENIKDSPGDSSEHMFISGCLSNNRKARAGYHNLETFQKQQLRQKLRKLNQPNSSNLPAAPSSTPQFLSPFLPRRNLLPSSPLLRRKVDVSQPPPVRLLRKRRKLVMYNKSPMWNETSQVYQLDFGGRVTQESAKNFQIEYKEKQVMQFGRIDPNAYTLDYQYPFTALQAFGVALANVTQRLK